MSLTIIITYKPFNGMKKSGAEMPRKMRCISFGISISLDMILHRNDVFTRNSDFIEALEIKNTDLYPPAPFLYKLIFAVASWASMLAKLAWFIFHESFGMNRWNIASLANH